jgi:hypothetical protein
MRALPGYLVILFFVFCLPSYAIPETTANQPPAPSAQGATQGNGPAQGLEQEIDSKVAEAGNGKASLTEVNKELSNPDFKYLGVAVST